MSSLDWYYRMEQFIRNSLPELSEEFSPFDIYMEGNVTEFHPSFSFTLSYDEEELEFCTILFDPVNQEFYSYYLHDELELDCKILLNDLDEVLDFIYFSFQAYMDEISSIIEELDETVKVPIEDSEEMEEELEIPIGPDEENVDWISNDKHVHIETTNQLGRNEYMIHLKIGVDRETGDGVLYRNILATDDEGEEETIFFPFKLEEAEFLVELLQDYIDYMEKN